KQLFDGFVLKLGILLERRVQPVDVRLMVLGVVDLHRLRVDVRLQRIVRVRQGGQFMFGHVMDPLLEIFGSRSPAADFVHSLYYSTFRAGLPGSVGRPPVGATTGPRPKARRGPRISSGGRRARRGAGGQKTSLRAEACNKLARGNQRCS